MACTVIVPPLSMKIGANVAWCACVVITSRVPSLSFMLTWYPGSAHTGEGDERTVAAVPDPQVRHAAEPRQGRSLVAGDGGAHVGGAVTEDLGDDLPSAVAGAGGERQRAVAAGGGAEQAVHLAGDLQELH